MINDLINVLISETLIHLCNLKEIVLTCVCVCRRHAVTPYCDTVRASPLQLTCRQDQLAVAVCNLQKYQQELPHEYQVHTYYTHYTRAAVRHA